jgi:hypothetical protein
MQTLYQKIRDYFILNSRIVAKLRYSQLMKQAGKISLSNKNPDFFNLPKKEQKRLTLEWIVERQRKEKENWKPDHNQSCKDGGALKFGDGFCVVS